MLPATPAGLRLTDQLLLEAAQAHITRLDVLVKAVLGRQQDQQLPEGAQMDGVTPLIQLSLLGSEQEIIAAVSYSQAARCMLLPLLLALSTSVIRNTRPCNVAVVRAVCGAVRLLFVCRSSRSCRTISCSSTSWQLC